MLANPFRKFAEPIVELLKNRAHPPSLQTLLKALLKTLFNALLKSDFNSSAFPGCDLRHVFFLLQEYDSCVEFQFEIRPQTHHPIDERVDGLNLIMV